MRRLAFRLPLGPWANITDDGLAALVGQSATVNLEGTMFRGSGVVVGAERYEDDLLGPGLWVTMDVAG